MADLKTCLGNETSLFSTLLIFYPFLITFRFGILVSVRVFFLAVQKEERSTAKRGKILVSVLHLCLCSTNFSIMKKIITFNKRKF